VCGLCALKWAWQTAFKWAWQTWALYWAWQSLDQSIGNDKTNTFQLKLYSRNKLALRSKISEISAFIPSKFSVFDSFRYIRVHIYDILKFVGGFWSFKWAWQTLKWAWQTLRTFFKLVGLEWETFFINR